MGHTVVASSFLCIVSVGLLVGCSDPPLDPQRYGVERKDLPVSVNRDVDLLFLIDDSPAMADKQNNLAANVPSFIEVLNSIPGGLPNVHIAVVTSDYGTTDANGGVAPAFGTLTRGGCANAGKAGDMQLFGASVSGGNYITDILQMDGITRLTNYTGTMSDAFAVMARAGAGGCGIEQHLEAMKQALDNNPVNAGFLRDSAYLAVIFVADEDDCSMSDSAALLTADETSLGPRQSFRCTRFGVVCDQGGSTPDAMNLVGTKTRCHPADSSPYLAKVSEYAQFLKGLKTDPNNVVAAGIMGTTAPFAVELRALPGSGTLAPALAHSCTYTGGEDANNDGIPDPAVAAPPIRLQSFLDQFPYRNAFAPICDQDLSGGLQQIGDLLKSVIVGDPCIRDRLADVDPETAGPQYDCAVSVVTNRGTSAERETVLPRCIPEDATAINQPCWHLTTDAMKCPKSDHIMLAIEGQTMLPSDAHVIASCLTVPGL